MELQKIEPHYIKNNGNWKPDTQYKCYLYKMPIKILKAMSGASENHRVHYNPRTVPKLPEELQGLILPFIEQCKITI